jgi:PAS domain S-box-containing protein
VTTLNPMRPLDELIDPVTPESAQEWPENTILQLRERVAELEAENAGLRELEETVRRNARLFEALLKKSHEGILLVTAQMTFLKVVHSVLGNSDDNLAGRLVLSNIHPDDRALATEAFSHLLNNPSQPVTVEWRVSDPAGDWHWMEVEMTDMLDDPDVHAIVINTRAMTGGKSEAARGERQCDRKKG